MLALSKILVKGLESSNKYTFTRFLELLPSHIPSSKTAQHVIYYKVPPSLCVKGGGTSFFAPSALIATFDELSTYQLMMNDKSSRPGVSVSLSCDMLGVISPDETITLKLYTDKIGMRLAFCSMTAENAAGAVVAKASHIKFVSMGWQWDLLNHPLILPLSRYILLNYGDFIQSKIFGKMSVCPPISPSSKSQVSWAFDQMHSTSKNKDTFIFPLSKTFLNYMGGVHGGAIAMAVEKSLYAKLLASTPSSTSVIQRLELTYISGLGGTLLINVLLILNINNNNILRHCIPFR